MSKKYIACQILTAMFHFRGFYLHFSSLERMRGKKFNYIFLNFITLRKCFQAWLFVQVGSNSEALLGLMQAIWKNKNSHWADLAVKFYFYLLMKCCRYSFIMPSCCQRHYIFRLSKFLWDVVSQKTLEVIFSNLP